MCFTHETRNESQQALVKLPVRSCETMIASAEIYNLWVQEHYFHYYFYYWLAIQLNYRSALRSLWLPSCHASKSTDLFNTLCGYFLSTKSTMTSSSGRIHVWHTIHYLTEWVCEWETCNNNSELYIKNSTSGGQCLQSCIGQTHRPKQQRQAPLSAVSEIIIYPCEKQKSKSF